MKIRQGGLYFEWVDRTRRIAVTRPGGANVDTLTVGNPFDSRPATLDEIHEAIDEYCEELKHGR